MSQFDIRAYLEESRQCIDTALDSLLPPAEAPPAPLHQAMRYCLFAGGKRLRPVLALAAAEAVGGQRETVIRPACALELVHTYTLIHDDLPAMDDDDLRRGCPATHTVYGEAMAILAGDALQAEAFQVLADSLPATIPSDRTITLFRELARACSSRGVVGGQAADILSEGQHIDTEHLQFIHTRKTGSLIRASVMIGALMGDASDGALELLGRYGEHIGLLFQITDDILDVVGSSKDLGKKTGSDARLGKATYPALLGMDAAREAQRTLHGKALECLEPFGERARPLRDLARLVVERMV